jgi:hypothetical protein
LSYEETFLAVRNRIISDLGDNFERTLLQDLKLSFNYVQSAKAGQNDRYASKSAKAPAYYNPNTHTIHLNTGVIKNAKTEVLENIYYHELTHAASHHARMELNGVQILKSGLKIQTWDQKKRPTTLHRGLNEGMTQYLANSHTSGGPAYRQEVDVIGRLIRRIGLTPLKAAYFGPAIDQLDRTMTAVFGTDAFNNLSTVVDNKEYELALKLI